MLTRTLQLVAGLIVAVGLLLSAWPQLIGVQHIGVFAQAVSLRGAGVALAVLGVIMLAALLTFLKPVRRFVLTLIVLLAVFAASNALVLTARGFGSTPVGFGSTLTVLSWNTMGDAPGAEAIADLAIKNGADVIALPETTAQTAQNVAHLMAAAGSPVTAHTIAYDEVSKGRSTSLLITASLGEYAIDTHRGNTGVLPSVVATPVNHVGPTIIAVHAVSPVHGETAEWRDDLAWLGKQCDGDVIMAGDFNATVDHLYSPVGSPFHKCTDAGLATRSAAVGTWPALIPAPLGSPIDHVIYSSQWQATGMRVVTDYDDSGSDHRPVLAWLGPQPDSEKTPVTPKLK